MQGFQNEKTRKMNIELSKTNFELVQQYAGLHIGKITYVLNYIIKMMANIPEEVRKKLLIFCEDRIEEMKQIPFIDETEVKQRIDAYQCLCHFFANETSKKDTMLSNDVEKFKTTVSFTPSNIKAATHEAKKIGTTFARYTNYLISLALDIPPRVQGELSVFCTAQASGVDEQNSLYWMYRARKIQDSYKELAVFWAQRSPYNSEKTTSLKRIEMKNGYIVYPPDWVVLDGVQCDAKDSVRACVIEIKNGQKYDMPHFLFFTNKDLGDPFTKDEENSVYLSCIKAVPNFIEVLRDGVDRPTMPITDPKYKEASERFLASPIPGIFYIPATDDPYYYMQDEPPFECRIVRNISKNED